MCGAGRRRGRPLRRGRRDDFRAATRHPRADVVRRCTCGRRRRRVLRELGFVAQTVSADLGVASAIKLCRSVVIKGLEALVIESFTAARLLGVEQQVLASLAETYPQFDWETPGRLPVLACDPARQAARRGDARERRRCSMRRRSAVSWPPRPRSVRRMWRRLARRGRFRGTHRHEAGLARRNGDMPHGASSTNGWRTRCVPVC